EMVTAERRSRNPFPGMLPNEPVLSGSISSNLRKTRAPRSFLAPDPRAVRRPRRQVHPAGIKWSGRGERAQCSDQAVDRRPELLADSGDRQGFRDQFLESAKVLGCHLGYRGLAGLGKLVPERLEAIDFGSCVSQLGKGGFGSRSILDIAQERGKRRVNV